MTSLISEELDLENQELTDKEKRALQNFKYNLKRAIRRKRNQKLGIKDPEINSFKELVR